MAGKSLFAETFRLGACLSALLRQAEGAGRDYPVSAFLMIYGPHMAANQLTFFRSFRLSAQGKARQSFGRLQ